jgi:hypothetical protein
MAKFHIMESGFPDVKAHEASGLRRRLAPG